MPTWCRCSPPILFWHWPPFNLFPSSYITWIFCVDSHWWVPLCVQHPTIYVPFWQIIMYILQCPHDIHVHLFCFDLHKFLLRSRTATCPTLNCGRGTSLLRQELVLCWKYWKVPLHLLVKWEVVSPYSRYREFLHEIGNIEKCPFTYWLNGRWFLQIVDIHVGNFNKNCGVSFWTCWREISGDRVALFVFVFTFVSCWL